ncbi:spermidine synthase [Corynebacterium yudongzhengii]|uniref:Spermidine synthase n=1 Tax=Corynebacterium yudongzhengii TaxID=2080740 RepID=A0A2U1T6M3_9CORY|nr:fused MFS/spermidine synthase [Corynebacterium yudongzhengii]AWB82191.1 spermidine synthase [Corynebacterium yudongzhengii]PWC01642.1 spermidine synthase [Corynebacterium yudongzhengii]
MSRTDKPRAPKKRITGTFPISTGTARITADETRDGAYLLEVNDVPSSHIVLGAPRVLTFPYMQWLAPLIDAHITRLPHRRGIHVVHLGGAGCALARYVADKWPSTRNTVSEIDADLARLVRASFDIPAPPAVDIVATEARSLIHALPAGGADVLIRDVFSGADTPRHLQTVEFFEAARRALGKGGLYAANVGDYAGLPVTRREAAGMLRAFRHVAAVAPLDMIEGRRYGNLLLLGSDQPLGDITAAAADDLRVRGMEFVARLSANERPLRD